MKVILLSDLRRRRNTGYHIYTVLYREGYEVIPFNIRGLGSKKSLTQKLSKVINKFQPDILLTYKGVGKISFSKVQTGVANPKRILWYPDTDVLDKNLNINPQLREIFEFHNFIFVIGKTWVPKLQTIFPNKKIDWLTQASRFYDYNVKQEIPMKYKCDIAFIGNVNGAIYKPRRALISEIIKKYANKCTIKIWGPKLKKGQTFYEILKPVHTNKRVFFKSFFYAVRGAKIIIGSDATDIPGSFSQKLYMVTGSAGFYLTRYIQGIEEVFEIGKEIEVFKDIPELLEKIDFYLANEEKRKQIAYNARARVLKEHLYEHRLKTLFEKVGAP